MIAIFVGQAKLLDALNSCMWAVLDIQAIGSGDIIRQNIDHWITERGVCVGFVSNLIDSSSNNWNEYKFNEDKNQSVMKCV